MQNLVTILPLNVADGPNYGIGLRFFAQLFDDALTLSIKISGAVFVIAASLLVPVIV